MMRFLSFSSVLMVTVCLGCASDDGTTSEPTGGVDAQALQSDWGEYCRTANDCIDDDARCSSSTCTPPPLGEERCETDLECSPGRVCQDSYCLLRRGEVCCDSSDCASGRCYGYYCGNATCT